jgi:D-xylonolactonase
MPRLLEVHRTQILEMDLERQQTCVPHGADPSALPALEYDIVASGFDFVEAPRFSPEGHVWFSDLTGSGVFRCRSDGEPEAMLPGRQWVGGLLFDVSGKVLCSGRGGIVALDPDTGEARDVLTEIEGEPIIAVNDMQGDGQGGFFAGTIDFVSIFENGTPPAPGLFFHMSAEGKAMVLRRDVLASNGIGASPCGTWLYHSETGRGIWRYPFVSDGLPGAGEIIVPLEDSDGLAVDAAGNVWVACWSTGHLKHFDPEGSLLRDLTFPYPHVVSVDFGAADPDHLLVSTGANADAPRSGAVLRLRVDVPGLSGPLTSLQMLG